MADERKRRVNPALLLGGGDSGSSASQPELVESGDFVSPRRARNFLPARSEEENASSDEPVTQLPAFVSDVDDEPSLDELEGLGLGRVNRRSTDEVVSPPVDIVEKPVSLPVNDEPSLDELEGLGFERAPRRDDVVDVVAPELAEPSVEDVIVLGVVSDSGSAVFGSELEVTDTVVVPSEVVSSDVVDEPSLDELEGLGVPKVERKRKVNPLFLAADEPPVEKKPVAKVPVKPEVVKPVSSRRVNPAFMLDKETSKPAARPGFLDTGRSPVRRPVTPVESESDVDEVSEDDRVRKLFVTRSDSKPRSPYTKRVDTNVDSEDWGDDVEGVSAGLGGEVDEGKRKADHKGFHFKERDAIILRFLARYRYAYVDQIARLVDSTPRNVMSRLRVLEKRGFIRREAVTGTQYLWTTRKAGNLLVDIGFKEIKKGNISYATISHTIGLANLGVEFERENGGKDLLGEGKGLDNWEPNFNRWKLGVWGHPEGKGYGEMTVTEREIRQGQTRWRGNRDTGEMRNLVMKAIANPSGPECEEGNEGLFVVYGLQGGEHVPDFVIARERNASGGVENIAIELELTEKTNAEWRKIIRNYRDNGQMFKKVYYFTHKKAIANALMKIIEMEGMEDRVVLRKYTPQNGRLPFWG